MIEVVAELSRGPVFLAGEALECVVTVTNPLPPTATSASSEALAWASAQIHCQFHASESRVALPPPTPVSQMSSLRARLSFFHTEVREVNVSFPLHQKSSSVT